jgi:integrase
MHSKKITWTAESVGYRTLSNGKRSYGYRWRDAAGVQRMRFLGSGSTERRAKAELAKVMSSKSRGEDVRVSREAFRAYANRWLDEQTGLESTTLSVYHWHLNKLILPSPHFRKAISRVTHNDVASFIADLRRYRRDDGTALKGWTIRGAVSVLSGIFAAAVDEGVLASNPVSRVSRKRREKVDDETSKRILTAEEVAVLLDAAGKRGLRWKALIGLFVFAGLRLGEALGLRWQDIDFAESAIHVRKQRDVKTGEPRGVKTKAGRREVRIGSQLAQILSAWSLETLHDAPNDPVITTVTGTSVSHRNAHRTVLEIALACGLNSKPEREDLPNLDPHSLRHTFASAMIKATRGDVEKVRAWLGHSDSGILLQRYAHQFDEVRGRRAEEARREVAAIDTAFGTASTSAGQH